MRISWKSITSVMNGGSASEVWRARMKDALHAGPGAVLHVAVEAAHINTDPLALRLGRPPYTGRSAQGALGPGPTRPAGGERASA